MTTPAEPEMTKFGSKLRETPSTKSSPSFQLRPPFPPIRILILTTKLNSGKGIIRPIRVRKNRKKPERRSKKRRSTFMTKTSRGQCYKTFYGRKLRLFIISYSVYLWQPFPTKSNVCGRGQEPTLEWRTWKVLHSGRLWPYPQTLY